ncbi:MAG TPA: VWA domain-containing protein [Gaiellaceae bacterium]|nr:VWA domain-containing protein [Gaiellaceae bacterium]
MVLLHPGALSLLALLVPLAVFEWRRVRRERNAARAVGLRPQRLWRALGNGVCAALVVALAAFAASEPSLRQTKRAALRADAEVYLFVDSSASMDAAASAGAPTRLQQARGAAAEFAQAMPPDLPLGAGALPQSPLPLTAPNGDRQLFLAAIDNMTVPGTLPEHLYGGRTATDFSNLASLASTRFFLPKTRRRIVVVFSDAEGPSFDTAATAASLKHVHIHLVFVRFGTSRDRIWLHSPGQKPVIDTNYVPDLSDLGEVRLLAGETGGGFYDQRRLGAATAKVERLAGHGPDRPGEPLSAFADSLAPYAALAALPLLAWLAGALLPLTAPLEVLSGRSRRGRAQRASEAASNQA